MSSWLMALTGLRLACCTFFVSLSLWISVLSSQINRHFKICLYWGWCHGLLDNPLPSWQSFSSWSSVWGSATETLPSRGKALEVRTEASWPSKTGSCEWPKRIRKQWAAKRPGKLGMWCWERGQVVTLQLHSANPNIISLRWQEERKHPLRTYRLKQVGPPEGRTQSSSDRVYLRALDQVRKQHWFIRF